MKRIVARDRYKAVRNTGRRQKESWHKVKLQTSSTLFQAVIREKVQKSVSNH